MASSATLDDRRASSRVRMAAYLVTVPFSMRGLRESPPPATPAGAALLLAVLAVLAVLTGGAAAPGSGNAACVSILSASGVLAAGATGEAPSKEATRARCSASRVTASLNWVRASLISVFKLAMAPSRVRISFSARKDSKSPSVLRRRSSERETSTRISAAAAFDR